MFPSRTTLRLQKIVLLLLFIILFHSLPAAAHAPLTVVWRAGLLSVSADQTRLAQILEEITRQTGMKIYGGEGLQTPVSVHFVDLPLDEGLQRLAVNSVIIWEMTSPTGQRPVAAFVSGGENAGSSSSPYQEAFFTKNSSAGKKQPGSSSSTDSNRALREAASTLLMRGDQEKAVAALVEGTKSEQKEQRLEALQLLAQTDRVEAETVVQALGEALTDPDVEIKGFALQTLAEREGVDPLPYLQQAWRDPDPAIRLLALEQAGRHEQGRSLVQEALADTDEEIRTLAASLSAGQ